MKKNLLLICLAMFIANTSFSQMSFSENMLKKSTFNFSEKKMSAFDGNATSSKVVITDEENDMMKKRRKRGGRSGGGGDFSFLSYSRLGVTIPIGALSDAANLGFLWQGMMEGVIQNKFGVGISFGYFIYFGKEISGPYGNTMTQEPAYVMPLAATFKYFLMEDDFKPYIGADLGVMFLGRDGYDSETKFGGTPRAGFIYSFADYYLIGFDVSANIVENGNGINFGLQFGYVFGN
ncbi:MAG: hypothetical protein ACOYLE_05140 [Bacteroidales bacterium]